MIPLGVLASARVAPSGGGGPSAGYLTSATTGTGTTTRTYAGLDFGTAAGDRTIIVVAHSRSRAPTSATIGGGAASLVASFADAFAHVAIFTAAVPTSTSGTVTVTHASGNPEASIIGVWAAYGTLTYDSHATQGDGKTVTVTSPADALIIAAMTQLTYNVGNDWTLDTIQDYGRIGEPCLAIGGHGQPAAGSYTVTVTSPYSNYGNSALMAVAFTLT